MTHTVLQTRHGMCKCTAVTLDREECSFVMFVYRSVLPSVYNSLLLVRLWAYCNEIGADTHRMVTSRSSFLFVFMNRRNGNRAYVLPVL